MGFTAWTLFCVLVSLLIDAKMSVIWLSWVNVALGFLNVYLKRPYSELSGVCDVQSRVDGRGDIQE